MSETKQNPANDRAELPKGFRPMSSGMLRLSVPEREGFHRHWFRGTPDRIAQAQLAGYAFVSSEDANLNNFDLAGLDSVTGSSDLGSRASVISGDLNENNQVGRLYLMECPIAYFEASQKVIADRNDAVAAAITSGLVGANETGESSNDAGNRYRKGKVPDLFNPNKRRP